MADEESSTPEEDQMERWIVITVVILVLASLIPILSKVKRSRGRNPLLHLFFFAIAITSVFLVPTQIQNALFSPVGVLMVGTIIPVYESIVAVCTIGMKDDIAWVQFWIVNATFTYATEWIDVLKESYPTIAEHWYEFEFFATLWFLLPFTDGSTLVYDMITKVRRRGLCLSLVSFKLLTISHL
jgi:receptor expression-enhancing protein 5/6